MIGVTENMSNPRNLQKFRTVYKSIKSVNFNRFKATVFLTVALNYYFTIDES